MSEEVGTITSVIAANNVLTSVKASRTCIPVTLMRERGVGKTVTVSVGRKPLTQTRRRVQTTELRGCVRAELSSKTRTLLPGRTSSVLVTKVNKRLVLRVLARKRLIYDATGRLVLRPRSRVRGIQRCLHRRRCGVRSRSVIYRRKGCCPVVHTMGARRSRA